jgi:DNA-binding winged helix-turn-helix (wHTH) protein
MDAIRGMKAASRRQGRRWLFASAVLDENSWTLVVDGRRVPLEVKPLELLHELLLRAGQVVTKDELLDAVWPGLAVVEASLPTAMLKLRRALGDHGRESPIIETVQRIGYRLAVPVEVETLRDSGAMRSPAGEASAAPAGIRLARPRRRWPTVVLGLAIALGAGTTLTIRTLHRSGAPAALPPGQLREAAGAIRALDVERVDRLLGEGWNPNTPFDNEGNAAVNMALTTCEWDRGHDRQRLMLLVRTLLDGGALLDRRNVWGDTAYSIAAAPRYCGRAHPVTRMLHDLCNVPAHPLGARCLADYAHAPARH